MFWLPQGDGGWRWWLHSIVKYFTEQLRRSGSHNISSWEHLLVSFFATWMASCLQFLSNTPTDTWTFWWSTSVLSTSCHFFSHMWYRSPLTRTLTANVRCIALLCAYEHVLLENQTSTSHMCLPGWKNSHQAFTHTPSSKIVHRAVFWRCILSLLNSLFAIEPFWFGGLEHYWGSCS